MKVSFYEGDRIYFRPLEIEDEPLLRLWFNDPRNWRTLLRNRPITAVQEKKFLEKLGESENEVVFGVVVREGDQLIGTAGLHKIEWVSRKAEFGICIGDVERQNCGFGTETTQLVLDYGFRVLNLNRIGLDVYADNPRGIRTYEKAGFVPEGQVREGSFRDGRYVDVLNYGILQREWVSHQTRVNETPKLIPVER